MNDYLFITHDFLNYVEVNCGNNYPLLCRLFEEFIKYGGDVLIKDLKTNYNPCINDMDSYYTEVMSNKDKYFNTIICDLWKDYCVFWNITSYVYRITSKMDKANAIQTLDCFIDCGGILKIDDALFFDVSELNNILQKTIK